jgi:hypothetical protein
MKILAIIDLAAGVGVDRIRNDIESEIKESWALFASGVLREAYATATGTRVIFVLEAEDVSHAKEHLQKLPLVSAGHFHFELVELRPFANWSMLFKH